ncbi:hypothetical protein [Kribbella italica]|uniref:Uncharacterized protein n=1 Tax=Kribbella italica TaxID=1540520 RepID=A0A7W9JAA6_9ACTN|nr:hypothetical protein [Kribbella italica]MBB5837778.1 hypothetical protein [Kribbella italica]
MLTIGVSAISAWILSEFSLDSDQAAFWRRWLGRFSYWWRRALYAVIPLGTGMVAAMFLRPADSVGQQIFQGFVGGCAATGALRVTPPGLAPGRSARGQTPDQVKANSVLTWMHKRAIERFDALTRRKIDEDLTRCRVSKDGDPSELLKLAEEIAGALRQESQAALAKQRERSARVLVQLNALMDEVGDPLATESQHNKAVFSTAELLREELCARRWNRPPVSKSKEGR